MTIQNHNNRSHAVYLVLAFFLSALVPRIALADAPVRMIRPLCVTEKGIRHFSVQSETFAEAGDYVHGIAGYSDPNMKHLSTLANKYSLLLGDNFSYTCSLPPARYKITGYRPKPTDEKCSSDMQITITLENKGARLFDKVPFSPYCIDDGSAYIAEFRIDEDASGSIHAVLSDGHSHTDFSFAHPARPVTAADIDCLAHKGYLDPQLSVKETALKTCLPALRK